MICVPRSGCVTGWHVGAISGGPGPIWDWHFDTHRVDRQRTGGSVDAFEAGQTRRFLPGCSRGFIIGMIEEAKDITLNEMVLQLH